MCGFVKISQRVEAIDQQRKTCILKDINRMTTLSVYFLLFEARNFEGSFVVLEISQHL